MIKDKEIKKCKEFINKTEDIKDFYNLAYKYGFKKGNLIGFSWYYKELSKE